MKCYLCGGEKHKKRPGSVRDNPELAINECETCGLVFLQPDRKTNYETGEMHSGSMTLTINQWLQLCDKDDERRFKFLKDTVVNRDVLDFGCGPGGFLMRVKSLAKSVTGIELESRTQPHLLDRGIKTDYEGKYDLITAFHVVEHLESPAEKLRELSKHLKPDGRLIVEVPNADDVLLTLYESEAFSRFTYWSCHLYLFNAKTLAMLGEKAGLKVDYIKHIQRYPLSNHLYWLAKSMMGGHLEWEFLDSDFLTTAYEAQLAAIGKTDTLIAGFKHAA